MFDSVSLFRILKTGFVNFWRNIWLSAAATMVMTITLVIFSILGLLFGVTKYSVATIQDRVDISVYYKTGVAESVIAQYKKELEQDPRVKAVTYVSAEQALQNFKDKHAKDPLVLDSLAELAENPLPATLQVKAQELSQYPELAKFIQDGPQKDRLSKINYEDNRLLIERLSRILQYILYGGGALALVFAIIAILVIFNTITLTIYNRREEVEIMRLVGATNGYIRGPFLVEAFLYSVVATVVTASLVLVLMSRVQAKAGILLGVDALGGPTGPFWSAGMVVLLLFVIALALSTISSMWAIRRYLKV